MDANALQELIQKKVSEAIKKAADEIITETQKAYELCIDVFYEEYDPRFYGRSYGLYNASEDYYADLGDGFEAGIKTNPSAIGSYYHDPADYVFHGAFGLGYHGTSQIFVGKRSGSKYMNMWRRAFYKKLPGLLRKYVKSISL